jgi:hypothetical protein
MDSATGPHSVVLHYLLLWKCSQFSSLVHGMISQKMQFFLCLRFKSVVQSLSDSCANCSK